MRILICDDEVQYIDELKDYVQEYMENHSIQYEIETTSFPEDILKSDKPYDLVFLDIQMPNINGLEIAYHLKDINNKVVIFIVTAFNKYQDDAMDLHVFRFFEKPFDVNRLYSSLDKAMEYIDGAYVDVFIYNNGEHKRVLVDDIIYIERRNRKTYIFTNYGEIVVNENIDEWAEKLPNTFFCQIHKSFIVNFHYVTSYGYTELYLNDKIRISIAPRKQVEIRKSWFNYLKRR